MKNILPILTVLCISLLIALVATFAYQKQDVSPLISPVLGNSQLPIAENIWFPNQASPEAVNINAPSITAEAAIFVETNSGQVLFQKNPHLRHRIASLTKIMTTILALEKGKLSDLFTVSMRSSQMEPDKMFLRPNEQLNLEELLCGMFLVSANDAAETIAENLVQSRDDFIRLMNEKGQSLGMKDSLFINPSGLEEDLEDGGSGEIKDQYSSAYDVALMSRFLIKKWPDILKITSSEHIYLPATPTHRDYDLYTGINLLTTYPGVIGLKTGYTPEAGLTLVTLARRGDKEVIGVLLGSQSRREDARVLLDYSFQKL